MPRSAPRKYFGHRLGDDPKMRAKLDRLGAAVLGLRQEQGLSLAQLAEKVGCSLHTIHNIEHARNWPALPVYVALCRELGVSNPPLL